MKLLKKRSIKAAALVLIVLIAFWHFAAEMTIYHLPEYPKEDILDILKNDALTKNDQMLIFRQTGLSPKAQDDFIKNGRTDLIESLGEYYFKEPEVQKTYVAYPITLQEKNLARTIPLAPLQNGDILVTFNTRTFDWRHGHCAIVLDADEGVALEHMSLGVESCKTPVKNWGNYPGFMVLRHPNKEIAEKAARYADEKLVGIEYKILSGIFKKDKSDEEIPSSSQCAHIVWQAYMAAGEDIDQGGDGIVLPKDIAESENLCLVQIYGIDAKKFEHRLMWHNNV